MTFNLHKIVAHACVYTHMREHTYDVGMRTDLFGGSGELDESLSLFFESDDLPCGRMSKINDIQSALTTYATAVCIKSSP
jgi:hypothetical protein